MMDGCIFCNGIDKDKVLLESDKWLVIYDGYAVSKGHVLLIPKGHYETYFDLPKEYVLELHGIILKVKKKLDEKFNPSGYNIGANCGKSGGQTIMHCHIHIIPRYDGDMEDPRGGVRGVIPSKQKY